MLAVLICVIFCVRGYSAQDDYPELSDLKRKDPGFMFAYTKTFLAGKNETVCLLLHDIAVPTRALIDLKIKERHHTITKIMHSDYSCFELPIPQHNTTEVLSASLHLQLQLNGSIQTAHNQEGIFIYPNTDVTFVETDRSVYKHGDRVRIRILVLTQELRPSFKEKAITQLKIINPQGFTVAVWDRIQTESGLAQIEYQLSEETVMGKWKIDCNGILKYFYVKRYILPRFKIEIIAPKTIYLKTSGVEFIVCGKYSFEKNVKGVVLIKLSYTHIHNTTTKFERMRNGCATFKLTPADLNMHILNVLERTHWTMHLVATLTEQGTNQIEMDTTTISIKAAPYELRFSDENVYFQPGLPYRGKLKLVSETNVDVERELVQICYQISVKKSWNIKPEECSEFFFEDDAAITFYILPLKENVVEIKLTAKSLNHTDTNIIESMSIKRWYSLTSNYLHLERNSKLVSKCRSAQQFMVYYNTNKLKHNENLTFYYMLKTRNEILQMRKIQHSPRRYAVNFENELTNIVGQVHKFHRMENYVDRFILKFKLHNKILSKSQLMVFYFNRDETVVGSIDIYVEKCLPNNVESSWMESKLYPGEYATLKINTTASSLCAVSAVDKSTTFMNNYKTLNVQNVLQPYLQQREPKPSNRPNCLMSQKRKLEALYLEEFGDLRRRRRSQSQGYTFGSKDFDAFETFNLFGMSVISNMRFISKPCMTEDASQYLIPRQFSTSTEYEVLNEDRGVSIRSYFPETWLWELVPTGKTGYGEVSRYLPHTITNWVTNILCVSPSEGVGIGVKQEITTFQPFFIDVIVPQSIKRHETLHLQVAVFNYMNYSLPIRITLGDVQGLDLLDGVDKRRTSLCVMPDDKVVNVYRVRGRSLGVVNITVLAEIESSYPSLCGPDVIVNKRDVVYKQLKIEPEGYETELVRSVLLCGNNDSNNITWDVELPTEAVRDSARAQIVLNSDLMGPTIQNLERFIDIPTGCGEQIMAVMAPNLYVLRYLKSSNKLTPAIRQRAVKNIKIGYQRILDYLHKDGSFSAFGYHDPTGSMFLTAFVLRTLQQAKEYTYVDEKVIKKSTRWIIDHQLENGCFTAVSHVFQDMGGTSTENSTAALTAYVIISLLESHIEIPESVRTNAMYCIRGQHNPDKYTLAISTYALYLLEWHSEADRCLSKLLEVATRDGKLMWWSNQSGNAAVNIEMTGYVLMSLLFKITNDNLINANAVVRWLGTQRGSQGGFVTTQDTAVALDALSRYTLLVKNRDPDLLIKIAAADETYDINIRKSDRIKSKQVVLSSIPSNLEVSAIGHGCLLAQLLVTYNVIRAINSEAFKLAVDVSPVSTIDKCSVAVVTPCVSYSSTGHSNMAVLEVSMPSGYEPDRASLYKLTDEESTKVKKFEEFKNRVVLYFTELDNEPICVPFNINENVIVEDQVDAVVKLYDYYNPEIEILKTYRMNTCQPNDVSVIPVVSELELQKLDKASSNITTLNQNVKAISKRNADRPTRKYGFNSDFVNIDVDMATPSGMEGNMPTYIKPNKKFKFT